jgi:hypothetical protein
MGNYSAEARGASFTGRGCGRYIWLWGGAYMNHRAHQYAPAFSPYTPASIVKLLVEIIEPFHGRILDPACGSAACSYSASDARTSEQELRQKLIESRPVAGVM